MRMPCLAEIPLRVENQIGDIEVSGDGGPGKLYESRIILAPS